MTKPQRLCRTNIDRFPAFASARTTNGVQALSLKVSTQIASLHELDSAFQVLLEAPLQECTHVGSRLGCSAAGAPSPPAYTHRGCISAAA